MIREATNKQIGAVAQGEKVGKVFVVVGEDAMSRKCLVCEQVFSRQASFEHSKTICYPPVSSTN